MTASAWLSAISGALLIASAISAFLGYRRFKENFHGELAQALVENALDRANDDAFGPPLDPGTVNMEWHRAEADRTVRRIFDAVGATLPDHYAYASIVLAGVAASLGLFAALVA